MQNHNVKYKYLECVVNDIQWLLACMYIHADIIGPTVHTDVCAGAIITWHNTQRPLSFQLTKTGRSCPLIGKVHVFISVTNWTNPFLVQSPDHGFRVLGLFDLLMCVSVPVVTLSGAWKAGTWPRQTRMQNTDVGHVRQREQNIEGVWWQRKKETRLYIFHSQTQTNTKEPEGYSAKADNPTTNRFSWRKPLFEQPNAVV